jgi:hypothetical protein
MREDGRVVPLKIVRVTRDAVATACLSLFVSPASAQHFECTADTVTNSRLVKSEWEFVGSSVANGKYTIVRSSEDSRLSKYPYEVSKLGTTSAFLDCQTTNRPTEPLQIVCGGLGNAFTFKESSKEFQEYYGIGYVDGADDSASTLSVTTGQCTQID